MITLIHGDHIEFSRQELTSLKQNVNGKEIRMLDGRTLDPAALTQALESSSLFGVDTLVIIENLTRYNAKKTKLLDQLAGIINSNAKSCDIILWEDKELSATQVNRFGKDVQTRLFKTPIVLFQFLDSLKPDSASSTLALFEKAVEKDAPELLFTMIVRRFRQLLIVKDGGTPEGITPWQSVRLTSQAKLFTMDKLVSMYEKLLTIEYSIKSGSSPFTMKEHIEQWLIEL